MLGCDSLLDLDGTALGKPASRQAAVVLWRRMSGQQGPAAHRARQAGQRLWLITSHDNVRAIGFYQRRGMDVVAAHRNFAAEVRKIKPWLPAESGGGIAFRHAIELEYSAPSAQ